MNTELSILVTAAVSAGFVHTLLGPDHYLPFIALSVSGKWSRLKTLIVTASCGIGHLLSSVIIAFAGVALGKTVLSVRVLEEFRGDIAAWLLIIFGFSYLIYGLHCAIKNKPHVHPHVHENGSVHVHTHTHADSHSHPHATAGRVSPWLIFIVFIFGPCETLIPLVMYPAAKGNLFEAVLVAALFSISTIATMLAAVLFSGKLAERFRLRNAERFSHAIAGSIILFSGIGVKFLGL